MSNYDYNNQRGGRRFGGNDRGRSNFSGSNSKKPYFKGPGDHQSSNGPSMMHKATCAECGNTCEVPFRPNGERPVYCKECFGNVGGNTGGDRFPRKESQTSARFMPSSENSRSNDAVVRQLEAVNVKLERLIQVVGALVSSKPAVPKEGLKEVIAGVIKKKTKKKSSKE